MLSVVLLSVVVPFCLVSFMLSAVYAEGCVWRVQDCLLLLQGILTEGEGSVQLTSSLR